MNDLMARAFEDIRYATVYNLAFDAYCMQHPGKYCVSAKSYAAHLMGLCHGLEHASDPESYWAIPFWLDGPAPVEIQKPSVVTARGALTVMYVHGPMEPAVYAARVREWARCVWEAHAVQHRLARGWLHQALATRQRGGV